MKKLILCIALIAFALSGAMAQGRDLKWLEMAPGKYVAANTQTIVSADSPCNNDGEAFKDFIPRFRSDEAFRNSRLHFEGDEMYQMSVEYFDNFSILTAVQKTQRCDKSFGTWYNVSANEVCFEYQDVLPCDQEFGGGSVNARFNRIDGKWYCTGFTIAG